MTGGVGVMVWVNEEIKLPSEKVQALNINTPSRIIIFFIMAYFTFLFLIPDFYMEMV